MSKKLIGWSLLGVLVVGALIFAGLMIYRDHTEEKAKEVNQAISKQLGSLYIDEKEGYFKASTEENDFDDVITYIQSQNNNKQSIQQVEQAKKNFNTQGEINQLFETEVLRGMDLSAEPVLSEPENNRKIVRLEQKVNNGSNTETGWGKDMLMILSIAKEQSKNYQTAINQIKKLSKQDTVDLSDYLDTVRAIALLPEGQYKNELIKDLEPVKNSLSEANQQLTQKISAGETAIAAEAAAYQQEQAAKIAERNEELSKVKESLSSKEKIYSSYQSVSQSISVSKAGSDSNSSSSSSSSTSVEESE
ncbi:hypothetical protein KUA55_09400 [Enterococcus sp. ALS3]|uniref:MapZ extracellular domain-containing protein n=1 Tax=Enterococcus alishanensis TaxID=1303817 RepID=A0ABS6TDD2_9ENTE|nr:hypothetical protein [Enterococcus alishanensis]MBV7390896.1 hypothetical protein [Enterococcus alishanensis]